MEEAKRKKILELYQGRYAKRQIAMIVHSDKRTITTVINDALAKGEVQETKAIRCDKGKLSESKRAISARRAQLAQQVRYAKICDLYKQGITYTDIAKELNTSYSTIKRTIDSAISNGDITATQSLEAKKLKFEKRKEKMQGKTWERKKHKKVLSEFPASTLAPGETIACSKKVSKKCVYGTNSILTDAQLCRYSLITDKCRSVGKDGCPSYACTKFSRISRTNPRLKIEGEI